MRTNTHAAWLTTVSLAAGLSLAPVPAAAQGGRHGTTHTGTQTQTQTQSGSGSPAQQGSPASNGGANEPTTPSVPAPPPRPEMNSSARGRYRDGLNAAQRGDLAGARQAFEGALAADAHAFAAAYNAGVIAERQGQDAQADSFYQRALTIQPDYELAVIARARLLTRGNRVNDAVALAQGVARQYPGNFAVRSEYARLLAVAGRFDAAIEEGRQILRLDERNVGARLAIAEAYRARNLRDEALFVVDDLINGSDAAHPNNGPGANDPRAHYLRGLLRLEINHDVPGAIQAFQRAAELDPQFAEAHNNLGVYLLQSGNYDDAMQHLRTAVALSPSWAKAHLNLGDALRATHSYDQALQELQRAQQLDPNLAEVHYNYGRLYGEQARDVATTGVDNLNHRLQLFQQSQTAFTHFRDMLGSNYATNVRHDDVEGQLARLQTLIERTNRALTRAQRAAQRQSEDQPAGGDSSGAADAGASQ